MTFLFLKIAGLMLLAAGFGAWLARWFFRHRYEDVTVQYQGWQNDWAQWRKGLDSKLSLRQMIDLSPVTERLNELESLVRGFGMPKPPPVDLEPVLEAVRNIRVPDAPTYDFTPLYSRMYQVEQHVAGIRIPDLAPLHQRLDSLEASVQRSVAAIEIPKPVPTDLTPVLESLVAVDHRIGSIRIPDLAPVMTGLESVVETTRADLAPLYARLAQVEKSVNDIPRPAPVDLMPVMECLSAVDAHIGAIRIPEPPSVQPLHARIDSVEKAVLSIRMPTLDLTPVHARMAELENRLEHAVRDSVASIPVPPAPKDTDLSPVLARVDAVGVPLMQRLDALEGRVAAIRLEVPPVDFSAIHARMDALEASLAQARGQVDFAPLDARLAQLEASVAQQVGDAVGKLPAPTAPNLAPVMDRIGSLEAKVQGIKFPPMPPVTNLTPLHDKLDALSRVVGGLKVPVAPAQAAPAPAVDLAPLRASFDKRLDALEHTLAGLRTAAPTPAPAVNLEPVVERLARLETALGRIETSTRAEAMTLRRSAPVATATVEAPPRKAASAPVPAPAASPVKIAEAAITKAAAEAESAQMGLGFDTRTVRSGSRNLLMHPAFGKPDNLKDIVGVAVGLERLLHEIGVYYFWQIAEWTPDDVAHVDTKLKAFKGRITRDAWISQSIKLAVKPGAAKKPA